MRMFTSGRRTWPLLLVVILFQVCRAVGAEDVDAGANSGEDVEKSQKDYRKFNEELQVSSTSHQGKSVGKYNGRNNGFYLDPKWRSDDHDDNVSTSTAADFSPNQSEGERPQSTKNDEDDRKTEQRDEEPSDSPDSTTGDDHSVKPPRRNGRRRLTDHQNLPRYGDGELDEEYRRPRPRRRRPPRIYDYYEPPRYTGSRYQSTQQSQMSQIQSQQQQQQPEATDVDQEFRRPMRPRRRRPVRIYDYDTDEPLPPRYRPRHRYYKRQRVRGGYRARTEDEQQQQQQPPVKTVETDLLPPLENETSSSTSSSTTSTTSSSTTTGSSITTGTSASVVTKVFTITPPSPTKANRSEEEEIMEFSDVQKTTEQSAWLKDLFESELPQNLKKLHNKINAKFEEANEEIFETTTELMKVNDTSSKRYEEILLGADPDLRAEIFELLSSGTKRLERLLKSRNMSFDEFVALRQRGLSRVHLNRIAEEKEKGVSQQQSQQQDYQNTEEIYEEQEDENVVNQKPDKIIDLLSAFGAPPMSEATNELDLSDTNRSSNLINYTSYEEPSSSMIFTKSHAADLDGIVIRRASEIGASGDKRRINSLRSTVVVIGAIFGVTMAVFLLIYSCSKFRQKQHYMSQNSFSRTVFQTPIMSNARKLSNSSSLNTIMVNVVTTSAANGGPMMATGDPMVNGDYEFRYEMENDSLDANDSWRTIPDFMK